MLAVKVYAQQGTAPDLPEKKLARLSANAVTSDETAHCLGCHSTRMPKIVEVWEQSAHAKNGVGCYECHRAEKGDLTAKQGHFSYNVHLQVSAARCGYCHQEQYEGFAASRHGTALDPIESLPIAKDDPEIFAISCAKCHGSAVNMKKGKPQDLSWPNHGIGRKNTDGSRGSCAACHGFHSDSLEYVRDARTCAKCHNTKVSPAISVFENSAHGAAPRKNIEDLDLGKKNLNLSEEGLTKPNCQVCHIMAADKMSKSTHNVSQRLSWNLKDLKAVHNDDWGTKRLEMQKTCRKCHGATHVEQYYRRFDAAVVATNHYVEKKVKADTPASEILCLQKSLIAFRIGVAMLGGIGPFKM